MLALKVLHICSPTSNRNPNLSLTMVTKLTTTQKQSSCHLPALLLRQSPFALSQSTPTPTPTPTTAPDSDPDPTPTPRDTQGRVGSCRFRSQARILSQCKYDHVANPNPNPDPTVTTKDLALTKKVDLTLTLALTQHTSALLSLLCSPAPVPADAGLPISSPEAPQQLPSSSPAAPQPLQCPNCYDGLPPSLLGPLLPL